MSPEGQDLVFHWVTLLCAFGMLAVTVVAWHDLKGTWPWQDDAFWLGAAGGVAGTWAGQRPWRTP